MKRIATALFIAALAVLLAACSSTRPQGTISSQSLSGLGDLVWHDANMNGVQDPGEEGVDGVTVRLYNCSGDFLAEGVTGQVDQSVKFFTIGNGNYSFTELLSPQVVAEQLDAEDMFGNAEPCYRVEVVLPGGYVFSPQDQGGDDGADSDVDPDTGLTADIVLPKAATDFTWDAGIYRPQNLTEGRFTGGINIDVDGLVVTGGLTLHCDITLSNNLEINWATDQENRWHLDKESLTDVVCFDDPAIEQRPPRAPLDTFYAEAVGKLTFGPYKNEDGSIIRFTFVDAGEPGRNDTVDIRIWAPGADPDVDAPVLDVFGNMERGGNLQAHYDQPHGGQP